jgi:hypothetical protein
VLSLVKNDIRRYQTSRHPWDDDSMTLYAKKNIIYTHEKTFSHNSIKYKISAIRPRDEDDDITNISSEDIHMVNSSRRTKQDYKRARVGEIYGLSNDFDYRLFSTHKAFVDELQMFPNNRAEELSKPSSPVNPFFCLHYFIQRVLIMMSKSV